MEFYQRWIISLLMIFAISACSIEEPLDVSTDIPTADAGADQLVPVGATVNLDGTDSSDPQGDPLSFNWVITQQPAGSLAILSDSTDDEPNFVADMAGDYLVELTVSDDSTTSEIDSVSVTASAIPIADAGPDKQAYLGGWALLDGRNSSDPEGDALTYLWESVSQPAGSSVQFSDNTTSSTWFAGSAVGTYVISLVVSDGLSDSTADQVTVTVDVYTPSCQTNSNCSFDEFCQKDAGSCGAPGTCEIIPDACILVYDPVCGCDGMTYGNSCEAATNGVNVAYQGPC